MNERSVNDSFTKLLEIICEADETTPRDVRALARTLAEFGYYTAKEGDATDDANALLEEATEVFFYRIKELLGENEEIKVGDKVHLNKDITTESNSRTEELCGVEEYMQGFGGDYVGEVLSIESSDVNPKYEVCLIRFINGYACYYAAEDLEKST